MILDFLFPKYCLECKKIGKYICDDCYSKVTPCGMIGDNFSIFRYEGVIRKAILSLKYKFATDIADGVVDICIDRLKSKKFINITLIPIPLHWQRENWRGFNQAEILGKKLAEKMDWKFVPDLLVRNKNTTPQVGLKGFARHSNISNAFSIDLNHNTYSIMHNTILIFDDVYTTGSTINEARKVLREAGFKKVYSLTIAK